MIFRARQFEFRFPRSVLIMGVVNVTPDSFSDGGKFFSPAKAVAHALKLIEQGAEILDIGGESTRPDATPATESEELRRVIPVIEKLAKKINSRRSETPSSQNQKIKNQESEDFRLTKKKSVVKPILISVDTMKPAVASAALKAGASIVNDVAASSRGGVWNGAASLEMWNIISEFRAGYVVMHAPPTLHKIKKQENIVVEVEKFFRERMAGMKNAGIAPEQVIFDPGIGFGKSLEQNLQLLGNLRSFSKLRRPLLLGASRKSFIEKLSGAPVNERLPASLACAIVAVESGAQIIRAHDVGETVRAVRMAEAILAQKNAN